MSIKPSVEKKNILFILNKLIYPVCITTLLISCGGSGSGSSGGRSAEDHYLSLDEAQRQTYQMSPIQVDGTIVDELGVPLNNITVHLGSHTTKSDADGRFSLEQAPRSNDYLKLEGDGIRPTIIAAYLHHPLGKSAVELPTVVAQSVNADETRLLFGGDVSFARRFLDPEETTPLTQVPASNDAALIQSDDPLPGSRDALRFVRTLFELSDYPVINFESPALSEPTTPHPTKDFAYFSLPESLHALAEIGIQCVSLGNNHVFDYLQSGLSDTLAAFDAAGIEYSGAGATPQAAFAPHRVDLSGTPVSLVSATSVSGSQHDILYVANESQGGAADLRDSVRVSDTIGGESDSGMFVIAQLHTGKEYTFSPSDYSYGRMQLAVDAGADLVIAHHPHVAQGFGFYNDKLMYHGLGNFLFDQDRHETMLGILAQVDVVSSEIARARGIPIYLEDYRPRPISGALADRFLRRLAEYSFGEGVTVFPYLNENWIRPPSQQPTLKQHSISLEMTVDDSGLAVIDLRHLAPAESSLAEITTNANGLAVQSGRDILLYGDFEDYDIDSDQFETARWDSNGETRFACQAWAYQGVQAMCITRGSTNENDSVVAFRNRVRVTGDAIDEANKDLSLIGYLKGENAGRIQLVTRYQASIGSGEFGEEIAYTHNGGTFDWQPFYADLNMPEDRPEFDSDKRYNPRALRLFIRHSPMDEGIGLAVADEIAVVNWETPEFLSGSLSYGTPHARDFLRVNGSPGNYVLNLTFNRYQPAQLE
ncbi:MAG: CapA family protein [Candidatus Thiodiazotropha sp.]